MPEMLHRAAAALSPSAATAPRAAAGTAGAAAPRQPPQVAAAVRSCAVLSNVRPVAAFVVQPRRTRHSRLAVTSSQASGQSIYAEEGPHGRYFEAVVTDFTRTRSGAVLKLLCTPRCAGLSAEQRCAAPCTSGPQLLTPLALRYATPLFSAPAFACTEA